MEDFKQYLSEDADELSRLAAEQVAEGLRGLRLEKKVAEVAAERRAWRQRRLWLQISLTALLAVMVGVAMLYFGKKEQSKAEQRMEQPGIQLPVATDTLTDNLPQIPQKEDIKKKREGPIAQNNNTDRLPSPRFSSPIIRGENTENKAWKALLDEIWHTEYPLAGMNVSETFEKADLLLKNRDFNNAYIQIQRLERKIPENDTLQFLKGYCLLEMGEGGEALRYFEKLEGKQGIWQYTLQWYKGLSTLFTGEQEKALVIFTKIAAEPTHPYREQSKKAIQLLR